MYPFPSMLLAPCTHSPFFLCPLPTPPPSPPPRYATTNSHPLTVDFTQIPRTPPPWFLSFPASPHLLFSFSFLHLPCFPSLAPTLHRYLLSRSIAHHVYTLPCYLGSWQPGDLHFSDSLASRGEALRKIGRQKRDSSISGRERGKADMWTLADRSFCVYSQFSSQSQLQGQGQLRNRWQFLAVSPVVS